MFSFSRCASAVLSTAFIFVGGSFASLASSPNLAPENTSFASAFENASGVTEGNSSETSAPAQDLVEDEVTYRYQCIEHLGRFLTVAQTPRGRVPLIIWQSESFGSQWTPEIRCRAVSTRFQTFARMDLLQYISTGELNNYPIICVSEEYGDCIGNGLLLTLEPQDNPTVVLKELFNLSDAITRSTTKPVIDLEYLLEEKNTLEDNDADTVTVPELDSND